MMAGYWCKLGQKDIPTVEFYLDPLCPACAQIDRILNDDIGKMYTSGQIKLEIHPVIFRQVFI